MRGTISRCRNRFFRSKLARRGTTTVEVALISPFLLLFIYMSFEISHIYAVQNSMRMACRIAAREGIVRGVTEAEVTSRVQEILSPLVHNTGDIQIIVKNASKFDSLDADENPVRYPTQSDSLVSEIWALPDQSDLAEAPIGHLFAVGIRIPYDNIALLPMVINGLADSIGTLYDQSELKGSDGFKGIELKTYAFMRHE